MKRIIILLLACALLLSTASIAAENPFTDVAQTDWFYGPVLWALEKGITTGKTATEFAPDGYCSRGQVVTFLWRLMGKPQPKNTVTPFTDVLTWKYYYPALCWAVETGVTTGVTETTFEPERSCTMGQIATFLWRAVGEPEPTNAELVKQYDSNKFYSKAAAYMDEIGAMAAVQRTFYPYGISYRDQIVTFIYYTDKSN